MKKFLIPILIISLFLISCGPEPRPADIELDDQPDVPDTPPVQTKTPEYKASLTISKTKTYDLKTEYIYNEPVSHTEIKEVTSIDVKIDDTSGAIVKVDGKELKEDLFPGLYQATTLEDWDLPSIELPKGEHTLTIDIDADGQIDGEQTFTIAGTELSSPEHGKSYPLSGFDLEWSAQNWQDFLYTYSTASAAQGSSCHGETNLYGSIRTKDLSQPKTQVDETFEDGIYLFTFKTTKNLQDNNDQDNTKITTLIMEEINMDLILGNVCQCCNHYEPACDPDLSYPYCD